MQLNLEIEAASGLSCPLHQRAAAQGNSINIAKPATSEGRDPYSIGAFHWWDHISVQLPYYIQAAFKDETGSYSSGGTSELRASTL